MADLIPVDARISVFAAEYVANGGNGLQAAVKAGFPEKGAATQAGRLLKKIHVREEIEKALRSQIKRIDKRGDQVITELFRILNVDVAEAYLPNGELKPVHEIPVDVRRAISGIEVDEIWDKDYVEGKPRKVQTGVTKKLKFWSKTESANLLGKHLKLWAENLGVNIFVDGDVEMTLDIKT